MRPSWRACDLLPALAALTVCAACDGPELASDLDDEGPPEILEVNVRTESAVFGGGQQVGESATFCRSGDQYRVNKTYCPEARDADNAPRPGVRDVAPVADAAPGDWYVRVIFDELLDPSVEELVTDASGTTGHIDQTRPVVLRCGGVELAYDGYWDPSGNHLSFPPGPALVVDPDEFVATGTPDCEISVTDVTDKDGEAVDGDQVGPYTFGIAPLRVYGIDPADQSTGVARGTEVQISFGAPIDLATVEGNVVLADADGDVVATEPAHYLLDDEGAIADTSIVVLTPSGPLEPDTEYAVTVNAGVADVAGGALAGDASFSAAFTTGTTE